MGGGGRWPTCPLWWLREPAVEASPLQGALWQLLLPGGWKAHPPVKELGEERALREAEEAAELGACIPHLVSAASSLEHPIPASLSPCDSSKPRAPSLQESLRGGPHPVLAPLRRWEAHYHSPLTRAARPTVG